MEKSNKGITFIKEYNLINLSKSKVKKDQIFEEIKKVDNKIQEDCKKIINESTGEIYAIVKKGIIKGVYLFQIETNENNKNLKHIKTIYTNDVPTDTREKFDNAILDGVISSVQYLEYDKVTFNNKVIELEPSKSKKDKITSYIIGAATGFIIGWIIFDEFFWGIIFGMLLSPFFNGLEVMVTNKKGRKKKNKEE